MSSVSCGFPLALVVPSSIHQSNTVSPRLMRSAPITSFQLSVDVKSPCVQEELPFEPFAVFWLISHAHSAAPRE